MAYLSSVPIEEVQGLAGKRGADLRKAGIRSVADLLLHAPRRYVDRSRTMLLADLPLGEEVTVIGVVERVSTRRPRRNLTIVEARVSDTSGTLTVVWFNQPFRERQLAVGSEVALSGKVDRFRGRLQMNAPDVDVLEGPAESLTTGRVMPVHPTVGGVGPGYLRRAIHNALGRARPLGDPVPVELLGRLGLGDRDSAVADIHFPEEMDRIPPARRRLVFDEFFRLEVALALRKNRQVVAAVGITHSLAGGLAASFLAALPYELTGAQVRAIAEIQADMASAHPMHRLLQGEVGSGKTVVAMAALLTAVQGGYQGAVMAPTEVLADQHYLGLEPLAALVGVRMGLLTGSSTDRAGVLASVANGTLDVVVGTHALIQEGVHFDRLGVAVVDEQHRFGVHQRVRLKEKAEGPEPDLLIMTATPIPRTLAMTLYGDLDVTVLDEMPTGRLPVSTSVVKPEPSALEAVYRLVRSEAAAGRQVFVVCPLVEESEKLQAASATAEYRRLQRVFPELRLGLLHGQMRSADKEVVMAAMRSGEIDVLVATTVIEVGIDLPNATVMVIEDADRFGLSQLHQLRGRVGRGSQESWCILIAEPTTPEGEERLAAMASTNDGFRLAEEDLRIRGQGTVFGARQAGLADLRMADILRDTEVLVAARREAFALVAADPDLTGHPELAEEIRALLGEDADWLFIS
ncbi:MAG: ATP-dependent DNA helicase RecG [Actinobacteria bacterium RBG_16_68_21]|nr:MAG: ATP-dependent DNA helicase RecG [Actinobacteria bacterium RBG_16_68_21]